MLRLLLLLPLLFGCGYRFVGAPYLPEGIRSIAIGEFQNLTAEPQLDSLLRRALREEFTFRGVPLVKSEEADATLEGRVIGISFRSLAYDESARARQYRATLQVDLRLVRGRRVLWEGRGLTETETFNVRGNEILDDEAKDRALRKMAEDLAEEVYLRLATGPWSPSRSSSTSQ